MKPRTQCKKCPWRVDVDPNEIPNGYSVEKHRALKNTIADASSPTFSNELRVMACHDSKPGKEFACVGWVANQIGPGNNIALRLQVMAGRIAPPKTVGEQHERFEDTLPDGRP